MCNLHLLPTFILTKMFTKKKKKHVSLSSSLLFAISLVNVLLNAMDSYSRLLLDRFET